MPGWHAPCSIPCMSPNFPLSRDVLDTSQHPLARAFASFTEAAGSLERAYGELQGQVVHLRQELEVTNRDLNLSLEENRRMRERLKRILESLPCGVLVVEGKSPWGDGVKIEARNKPFPAWLAGRASPPNLNPCIRFLGPLTWNLVRWQT